MYVCSYLSTYMHDGLMDGLNLYPKFDVPAHAREAEKAPQHGARGGVSYAAVVCRV